MKKQSLTDNPYPEDVYMSLKVDDVPIKGKKGSAKVEQYEEYTARPDGDGKMKDVDDGVPDEVVQEGTMFEDTMTEFGKTKLFNYKELETFGYNIVIYPVTTQRLAMKNVEDGLRDIYANGHQNNIIDKMQTRKRLYELVDYEKYNSLDEKIYNFSTEGHE